jgi:hypothetical protein
VQRYIKRTGVSLISKRYTGRFLRFLRTRSTREAIAGFIERTSAGVGVGDSFFGAERKLNSPACGYVDGACQRSGGEGCRPFDRDSTALLTGATHREGSVYCSLPTGGVPIIRGKRKMKQWTLPSLSLSPLNNACKRSKWSLIWNSEAPVYMVHSGKKEIKEKETVHVYCQIRPSLDVTARQEPTEV